MKCNLGLKRNELQKKRQKEFVQNVIEKFAINQIDFFECMYRYDFEGRHVISKYDLGILLRRKGILTAREVLGMQQMAAKYKVGAQNHLIKYRSLIDEMKEVCREEESHRQDDDDDDDAEMFDTRSGTK
jgi:hypothetical protein